MDNTLNIAYLDWVELALLSPDFWSTVIHVLLHATELVLFRQTIESLCAWLCDLLKGEDNLGDPGIVITQSLDSTQQQWKAKWGVVSVRFKLWFVGRQLWLKQMTLE